MTDKEYSERDLKIAEQISEIKAIISANSDLLHGYSNRFEQMLADKESTHRILWKKTEDHGKSIAWMKGIGLGLQAVWAGLVAWFGMRHG